MLIFLSEVQLDLNFATNRFRIVLFLYKGSLFLSKLEKCKYFKISFSLSLEIIFSKIGV